MKMISMKKMFIMFIMFGLFLFLGTFFHMDQVQATTYVENDPWYGTNLDFSEVNESIIEFESNYIPFSEIISDPLMIDPAKTYVIESASDLYMFSKLNNGLDYDVYRRLNYVLGNHIDYYDVVMTDSSKTFEPVGFMYPFLGTFDGQGFEITNLYFEPIYDYSVYEQKYLGLVYYAMFSHVGSSGVIKNLGLINPLIIQPIEWGTMSYISPLVGLNEGYVHHVYYMDDRGHQAGFNAEGKFHISGLVSNNQGILEESYVVSPHIKSLAVLENSSTSAVVSENTGIVSQVYYDQNILLDQETLKNHSTGLSTIDFQNEIYFDQAWYFNTDYESLTDDLILKNQYHLNNTYPILHGIDISEGKLLISDAIEFIYMNRLFEKGNLFRSQTYEIVHDIDMNQVAFDAYQQASLGFNGTLTSKVIDQNSILYNRDQLQGGTTNYHSIIGLNISNASYVGNSATYGIFTILFGTVEHLNFIDVTLRTVDINQTYQRDFLSIGVVAGEINLGTIYDVHVQGELIVNQSSQPISHLSLGMLAGKGSGLISHASSKGNINVDAQTYQVKSDGNSMGGIIGQANEIVITETIDSTTKNGISYINNFIGKTYLGGMIGSGTIKELSFVISKGDMIITNDDYQQELYVGGIFGHGELVGSSMTNLYHNGSIDVYVNQALDIKINGIGYIKSDEISNEIKSITNHGSISLSSDVLLSTTALANMSIHGSYGLTIDGSASIYGIYQTQDQLIDLSLIDSMSGILTHLSTNPLRIVKAYQKSNLMFQTYHELTQEHIKLSGGLLGEYYDVDHIRQEGYLDININHVSSRSSQGLLEVTGLFETINNEYAIKNGYQGGNISIAKDDLIDVKYDINVSGIGIRHLNINHLIENNIDPQSVEISDIKGSVDTMLNSGNIDISGDFNGDVKASGIMLFNYGLMTEVINLGNISIFNDLSQVDDTIEGSGIVHQMIGAYAQIKDTANHGNIKVVSNTSFGYAHASGLVLRNDRLENQTDVIGGNQHKFQKILFSINYGDIYAYNNSDETLYTVADETRAKASGFLAIGVLSTINNVNFGNIFSNHLASAMIGFLSLDKFGTLGYDEVYISNQMNYGRVREISGFNSVDETFSMDMNLAPVDQDYHGFGAIVGKIHTGTLEWDFVGSSVEYPIDRIYYGYLLNFDEKIDMFDQAPPVSSTWSSTYEDDVATAAAIVLQMQKYMATTNPNDQSKAPFNDFYVGGKFGMYLGKQIDYYDLTDTSIGIFYEDFAFRDQRPAYKGTDQYILDYIQYIPRDKINTHMLDRLETYSLSTYTGMYALSSSSGIDNGIFMPDNFDLEGLHEYSQTNPNGDQTYLGDPLDQTSISYALYTSMRQIKVDFATTIYDLEIKQIDIYGNTVQDGVILRDPVIDQERSLITYYLPSNAAILGNEIPTIMNVESYVEVSPNVTGAKKVLDLMSGGDPTYTWVGTHKKYNNQMVEIGPYKETGIYEITSNMAYSSSNNLNKPLYNYGGLYDTLDAVNHIFIHNPHIYNANASAEKWSAEGYQVTATGPFTGGYAPYEPFYIDGYPELYRYVGPSTETITYVPSNNIDGVSVYDPSDVRFIANTDLGTYQISETASLEYLEMTLLEPISIPRSYGIYDMMTLNGEYVDSVEDHYGMIRVFSKSYQETDPSTYKDYEIRVIRTADESMTDVLSLTVNGIDALNPLDTISELTAAINLNGTLDNILEVSYETNNISDLYNMLQHVEVYNFDTQVKVNTSFYRLEQGHVSTLQTFDNLNGTWGTGSFTLSFIPEDTFPSGNYMIKTTLLSGTSYHIYFTKDQSSENSILSFDFDGKHIEPTSNSHISYIPYGIFYDVMDHQTDIVNFSNLSSISNLYYDQVDQMLPSYLDGLVISNFATLQHITLSITTLVDGRYQYDIIYEIVAENMSSQTFTHTLIESQISSSPSAIYKNGGELSPLEHVNVSYEESPNIRIVYDLDEFYVSHMDLFSVSAMFTPLNMGDTALLNQDYFIRKIDDVGFEVNLNGNISKGAYQFQMTYQNEITLWGEVLSWSFAFNDVFVDKLKNDQSKVEDILFVSDTIFSGFNTIVDVEYMDITAYEGYMNNPSSRKINVLPTTGVVYNDYDDANVYYIIGQVQKTNLSIYEPIFDISDYAIIRKVTDSSNLHYSYQSEELAADYSPIGDTFNYVHYRIYAEDFDQYPTHYTDFYIAVQDVTNNIKFEITIDNQTGEVLNNLFFTIDICQGVTECSSSDSVYKMGAYAVYNELLDTYELTHFQTTMHGTYILYIDLGVGYSYQIILKQSQISGNSFYLEDSILPRKYYITIIITTNLEQNEWGYTHENTPLS